MRIVIIIILFATIVSCDSYQNELPVDDYRVTLEMKDDKILPFNIKMRSDGVIEMYNAEEVIEVSKISYPKGKIRIGFPIYEGYIQGKFDNGKVQDARFVKESLDRVVPVHFEQGNTNRFIDVLPTIHDVTGTWEMLFTEKDSSTFIAKGIFNQNGNKVTGTIRTTTGDHRYLEGVVSGDELKISAFDGAHAFLYTADLTGDQMDDGGFYYGNHYKSTFIAKKNPKYELPHEDSLTFLNPNYERFEFSFPDLDDKMISLDDARFEGKVVIAQIMGSWCPNCIDESKYYVDYYKNNSHPDLEFVALAFEYASTKKKAYNGLKRLKEVLDIEYPILLAQYGTSDKKEAQKKLPMLNHVLSYPTTIFIDKKKNVRKIHTGYNGPATGQKYEEFKVEFESFVRSLLQE